MIGNRKDARVIEAIDKFAPGKPADDVVEAINAFADGIGRKSLPLAGRNMAAASQGNHGAEYVNHLSSLRSSDAPADQQITLKLVAYVAEVLVKRFAIVSCITRPVKPTRIPFQSCVQTTRWALQFILAASVQGVLLLGMHTRRQVSNRPFIAGQSTQSPLEALRAPPRSEPCEITANAMPSVMTL